jgi:hypothetical protein
LVETEDEEEDSTFLLFDTYDTAVGASDPILKLEAEGFIETLSCRNLHELPYLQLFFKKAEQILSVGLLDARKSAGGGLL